MIEGERKYLHPGPVSADASRAYRIKSIPAFTQDGVCSDLNAVIALVGLLRRTLGTRRVYAMLMHNVGLLPVAVASFVPLFGLCIPV